MRPRHATDGARQAAGTVLSTGQTHQSAHVTDHRSSPNDQVPRTAAARRQSGVPGRVHQNPPRRQEDGVRLQPCAHVGVAVYLPSHLERGYRAYHARGRAGAKGSGRHRHIRRSIGRVACACVVSVKGEVHRSRCTAWGALTVLHAAGWSVIDRVTTIVVDYRITELLQLVVRARTRRGENRANVCWCAQCAVERRIRS